MEDKEDKEDKTNIEIANILLFSLPMLIKRLTHDLENSRPNRKLHLLFEIANHGNLNMTDYSEKMMLPKSNITIFVNHMVKEGLVERITDEKDRRNIYLQITEKGNKFIFKSIKDLEEHVSEKIKNKYTPEEIKQITFHMKELIKLLDKKI